MIELLEFEEIFFCKFGNGKAKGHVYFAYDDNQIKILSGTNT